MTIRGACFLSIHFYTDIITYALNLYILNWYNTNTHVKYHDDFIVWESLDMHSFTSEWLY